MLELEAGTGTESMDAELLAKDRITRSEAKVQSNTVRYALHISDLSWHHVINKGLGRILSLVESCL